VNNLLEIKTLYVRNRLQWRNWLEQHHVSDTSGIWLVYYKQHSGKPSIGYEESVEEALCFGWVDSLIKRLDDDRYARKFTPRKPTSNWSESNRKRIARLEKRGMMTEAGLASVAAAKASGSWFGSNGSENSERIPEEFNKLLADNHAARVFFKKLTDAQRRNYLRWINQAQQESTRHRRMRESIILLEQGRVLGMK